MRKLIFIAFFTFLLATPVHASELTAPPAPAAAEEKMPENTNDFAEGLWQMIGKAIGAVRPDLKEAAKVCLGLVATVLLISILHTFSERAKQCSNLTGTASIAAVLLLSTNSLISLGTETITQMCEYGKLLLPVMTAAMAAQGGVTLSAALHTGTALFIAILSSLVEKLLMPMVFLFLALSVANSATGESLLKRMRDLMKWAVSWCLKSVLTVFTTYMGITGVVSGTADVVTAKAAKTVISSAVPVVGGILSNATESVLVGASLIKNSAGIYGIFAVMAIFLEPFLRIGVHYLMLKLTASVCGIFGCKEITDLIGDFSDAMGLLLAMTGSVCLLLLISTVCFLKGVG